MPRVSRPMNGRAASAKQVSHAKVPEDDADDPDDGQGDSSTPGDDTPAVRPPIDALSEMMAGLQGASTSRISVYRIVKNQPPSYVFECDPTSFSLDDLRDKYNGGEFRLYIMKDGRLWKNMRVVVEPKQMFHGQEPSPPSTTPVTEMMSLMREGFAAQASALREAMLARASPSPFSMMDLPAVITAVAAAITALRPAPAPAQPDNTSQALEMFMRGMEIAGDRNPTDNSLGGMLRDVLKSPILATAVQAASQPPAPARQPNPALPSPAQVSHAKPADSIVVPQMEQNKVLAYYLGFLVGKAKTDADASLYAELVLDNVPDAQLTPMLARGDALIEDLIAIHPPVAEHRAWFISLIKEINEVLASDDESEEVLSQSGEANATDATPIVVPGNAAS